MTDWFALKVLFEPIEPILVMGRFKVETFFTFLAIFLLCFISHMFKKVHGLFLQRQKEVSVDFSEFVVSNLVTADKLWAELCGGIRAGQLTLLIANELQNEIGWLEKTSSHSEGFEPVRWDTQALVVQTALKDALTGSTLKHLDTSLDLKNSLYIAMLKLKSTEFEKVLHPIFQEDESTLIAVGALLGMIAGVAQVPFY